ncbi:precorrin-3 methyltransferase [Insolitispirillum peregrinum]|uniref:Precorrin-3 methyltransferase n=2 Tax=Insolitispirillum peregrinum TaxID=80876 RepID=A0A1N7NUZ7_9PROT|nr:precorrin-3 methyltransferase [Insolitispirillum peregrinum]
MAAILILGQGSLPTARRLQAALPEAVIYGLKGRVTGADRVYDGFGETLRELYQRDVPIIALCASGIIIRSLAPLLQNKRVEPPVLAVAEDGSAVVPLLGGLRGVNDLARRIGAALGQAPAITTTGEVRLALTLEHPPSGYVLRNPADGKAFMSDVLAGETVRVIGQAPWLAASRLVNDPNGRLILRVTTEDHQPEVGELVFHPRSLVLAAREVSDDLPQQVQAALAAERLAVQAVACLLVPVVAAGQPAAHQAAALLGCPLRFGDADLPDARHHGPIAIAQASDPTALSLPGLRQGRLAVIGLGPGAADLMAPAVKDELHRAGHLIGYDPYLQMAGPFRPDQVVHGSDNRVEMDRARHALQLAAAGERVVVVSSGDPGVFAMATAVMEALHASDDPLWHGVDLVVLPGISAAQAAAARAGAPLGHDFCTLSLSDNLKPWSVILDRLIHAAQADLVLALYNPLSRARPWQLGEALELLRRYRAPETVVVLGRDVGRPAEAMTITTLRELHPQQVDMRTVVIIGSSLTRHFPRGAGGQWAYTPRWYPNQ